MAETYNYHINLWPEPPGPPTYLCLLCTLTDCTHAEILAHIPTAHSLEPTPTPLAAQASSMPSFLRETFRHAD